MDTILAVMPRLGGAAARHAARMLLLLILLFAPTSGGTAKAQEVAPAAAGRVVVRTAFAELDSLRWSGAAALVHPETLARFREWALENARAAERHQLEPYPRDPDMPPAVAAWFEMRRRKAEEERKRLGSELSYQFAGVDSVAQLEALSAQEILARHLQAIDPRDIVRRHLRAAMSDVPLPASIELDTLFRAQRTIIGAAVEDDTTVHVVYRTRFPERTEHGAGEVAVVTVRRTPAGWRIWSASHDVPLFDAYQGFTVFGVVTDSEVRKQRR